MPVIRHENLRLVVPIKNVKTDQWYRLIPLSDSVALGESGLNQIVAICNQAAVYTLLFADRLTGTPYSLTDAERFVSWAQRGWRERTHFVFVIVADGSNEVVGALDIKSNQAESAEIGYWLSAEHSGVMTNAVLELVSLARDAGYQQLFGMVRETNLRSAGVLMRAGFSPTEQIEKNGRVYHRFTRQL